jgi:hypothetical protein
VPRVETKIKKGAVVRASVVYINNMSEW